MVTGCVIRKCSSVWSPISYTSYHCFPLKNPELMEKWMKAIPPGYIAIPKHSSRICSRHFLEDCFNYSESGKRTLKKDAVPTLFGSEAKKEDILSPTKSNRDRDSMDSDFCYEEEEQKHCRYVKRSKYLQPEKPKQDMSTQNRALVNKTEHSKLAEQKLRKPKISQKEIELKKQIIILKKRLLRRESRIKTMMEAMNSYPTVIIKTEEVE